MGAVDRKGPKPIAWLCAGLCLLVLVVGVWFWAPWRIPEYAFLQGSSPVFIGAGSEWPGEFRRRTQLFYA